MAKRKGSTSGSRKQSVKRASKSSKAAKKRVARKAAPRKSATAASRRLATARTAAKRKKVAKKRVAPRVATPKRVAKKAPARKATATKRARKTTAARTGPKRAELAKSAARSAPRPVARKAAPRRRADAAPMRKAPALDRDRRTVPEDDLFPTPPSTLDLDRSASAVRTGRRAMRERFDQHTETSPALTGGDVDADWESAYSVGDEAPGGDNPTPDQDIVDDIGRAVGVEYQDNEELKGEDKIADRDRHRWELDPASAEDYDEH